MTIKSFIFNPFRENTYLIYSETGNAIIIDAGCLFDSEKQELAQFIKANHLTISKVLNTHLHIDHQFGNKFLFQEFGTAPEAGKEDEFLLAGAKSQASIFGLPYTEEPQLLSHYIIDNEIIEVDDIQLIALHVPGHSPGSFAFYSPKDGIIFSGDVLFKGSIGRTDLQKGDYATLINSINKKLLPLPDPTIVYSGHGPTTTIGEEKINNPYL